MSEKSKSFSRPKVRFSQKSLSPENTTDTPRLFHGPKIRDIITLKKPVIMIRPKEKTDTVKVVDHSKKEPASISTRKTTKDSSPSKEPVNTIDQLQKQTDSLKISSDKPDLNVKIPGAVESVGSKLSSSKSSKSGAIPTITIVEKTSQVVANVLQTHSKSSKLPGNKENVVKSNSLNNITSKLKNNKVASDPIRRRSENKENTARKISSSRSIKVTPSKPESAVKSAKSLTVLSKSAPTKSPKRIINSSKRTTVLCREPKIPVAGTMACMKSRRNPHKSPARKSVVRNRAVAPPNIYVGPGVLKTQSASSSRSPDAKELYKKPDVFSSNKLIKPEYNSIVSTMKKMEKTKKEKVATDIDSLPATYKNLIMEKVKKKKTFIILLIILLSIS